MVKSPTPVVKYEDVDPVVLFLERCADLEWATAGLPDSRDVLLRDIVVKAKELLDKR